MKSKTKVPAAIVALAEQQKANKHQSYRKHGILAARVDSDLQDMVRESLEHVEPRVLINAALRHYFESAIVPNAA